MRIPICVVVVLLMGGFVESVQDGVQYPLNTSEKGIIGGIRDQEVPRSYKRLHHRVGRVTQKLLRFNKEQKKDVLDLHNRYRSSVIPSAANMRIMTWDSALEATAQQWADSCVFEHGMPPGADKEVGQNLYKGSESIGDPGLTATVLWHNETHDYDYSSNSCREGVDIQCGHYTQVIWDASHQLGCAVASCFDEKIQSPWAYVVCHYKPQGNYPRQPYSVGEPCSLCNTPDGGLCTNNLCVTKDECESTNSTCDCPLKCHNCGILDSENCKCKCKAGWDSLDCSKTCKDTHSMCRQNPGFYDERSCVQPGVQSEHCRLMCGECRGLPSKKTDDVCCDGKLCPDGHVLDTEACTCVALFQGPVGQSVSQDLNENGGRTIQDSMHIVAVGMWLCLIAWLR